VGWLGNTVKRLKGGDQAAMADEISAALDRGDSPDLGDAAQRHGCAIDLAERILTEQRRVRFLALIEQDYSDGRFSAYLAKQRSIDGGLTTDEFDRALHGWVLGKLQPLIDEITADDMVDHAEDARLEQALARLPGISLNEQSAAAIATMRAKWQGIFDAANDPLTPVEAPVLLKANEYCVHVVHAEATEIRQRTTRVGYSGPRATIRIAKGLSYSMGSYSVSRSVEQYEHSFGSGALCATNKRLLWIGPEKSISIPLGNIVRFDQFMDGLCVYKGTGKPLLFKWYTTDQPATIKLARTIEELR
jgi:hypothetical protein